MPQTPPTLPKKRKVATTIRLDPEIKRQGQMLTHQMGIDLSTFFTIKLSELIHTGILYTDMREIASPAVIQELKQIQ
jgi:antitoxin component of RelBE/YafQ-DinJ toxin-antitoxin module